LRVHICAAAVPSTVATEIPYARTVRFLILSGLHPASRTALSRFIGEIREPPAPRSSEEAEEEENKNFIASARHSVFRLYKAALGHSRHVACDVLAPLLVLVEGPLITCHRPGCSGCMGIVAL
jgi:hypothetical protein